MKKNVLFFLLLISSAVIIAQNSLVGGVNIQHHVNTSLVKNINSTAMISCVNSGYDTVSFFYISKDYEYYERIITGYWVNDIYIVKDTLFFCGRTVGNRYELGILGFFKFDTCFSHVDSIFIYDEFYAGNALYNVNELTKMESFHDSYGVRHLACIGKCNNNNLPCLLDVSRPSFSPTAWNYFGGAILDENEVLSDVKYIRTYMDFSNRLVTAGFDVTNGRYINLRVYEPDYLLNPYGPQDNPFYFCNDIYDQRQWVGDDILLSDIKDGLFSTVSYRYGNKNQLRDDPYSIADRLHIAFYDLPVFLVPLTTGMTRNYYIDLSAYLRKKLNQYILQPGSQNLELMHTMTPGSSTPESIFFTIDHQSLGVSGNLDAFKYPTADMQGMTALGGNKFVMSGAYVTLRKWALYEKEAFANHTTCAETLKYDYYQEITPSATCQNKAFDTMMGKIEWKTVGFTWRQMHLQTLCEH